MKLSEELYVKICEAVVSLRDSFPRHPNDVDSGDVVDAVLDALYGSEWSIELGVEGDS